VNTQHRPAAAQLATSISSWRALLSVGERSDCLAELAQPTALLGQLELFDGELFTSGGQLGLHRLQALVQIRHRLLMNLSLSREPRRGHQLKFTLQCLEQLRVFALDEAWCRCSIARLGRSRRWGWSPLCEQPVVDLGGWTATAARRDTCAHVLAVGVLLLESVDAFAGGVSTTAQLGGDVTSGVPADRDHDQSIGRGPEWPGTLRGHVPLRSRDTTVRYQCGRSAPSVSGQSRSRCIRARRDTRCLHGCNSITAGERRHVAKTQELALGATRTSSQVFDQTPVAVNNYWVSESHQQPHGSRMALLNTLTRPRDIIRTCLGNVSRTESTATRAMGTLFGHVPNMSDCSAAALDQATLRAPQRWRGMRQRRTPQISTSTHGGGGIA